MKIKNSYNILCTTLSFTFLVYSFLFAAPVKVQKEDYNFDTFLNVTPLQFSMNTIKYYFDSHNVGTRSVLNTDEQEKACADSIFSRSFSQYIGEVYNKQNYATMFSQDGTHLVDFLQLSDELCLSSTTLYVGLRLFHNKMKSCEVIDDTVILQIIEPIGKHLEKYFEEQELEHKTNLSFLRKHTEELMLAKFTDHYATFQQEPDVFLSNLSEEITKQFKQEVSHIEKNFKDSQEKFEARERLRTITIRFLETALSKTMWPTQSYEGIWFSFQTIAHDLQALGTRGVINHMDDLDSLLWSHTHRFCFFLDVFGSHLPLEFYEEVETDLNNREVYFLEEKEQDACIKTKKETLEQALIKGKMKAVAYSRGIVDHIV